MSGYLDIEHCLAFRASDLYIPQYIDIVSETGLAELYPVQFTKVECHPIACRYDLDTRLFCKLFRD